MNNLVQGFAIRILVYVPFGKPSIVLCLYTNKTSLQIYQYLIVINMSIWHFSLVKSSMNNYVLIYGIDIH